MLELVTLGYLEPACQYSMVILDLYIYIVTKCWLVKKFGFGKIVVKWGREGSKFQKNL